MSDLLLIPSTSCASQSCKSSLLELQRQARAARAFLPGLWEWNLASNVVWYSDEFLEMVGKTAGQFPPNFSSWLDLLNEQDRDRVWDTIQTVLNERGRFDLEFRQLRPGGDFAWYRSQGMVYPDDAGRALFLSGSLECIDELKTAQHAQREREARSEQSRKLEAVGNLASGISHEFNNLLQSIRGYAVFAQQSTSPDSPAQEDLARVLLATDKASKITRQLLNFSRPSKVVPQRGSVNHLVEETALLVTPLLPENIELRLELDTIDDRALLDEVSFQQALLNLCINARDAMPMGGELLISTRLIDESELAAEAFAELPPGRYVCTSVFDTGTGIPQNIQDRIFDPFFTTKDAGTGLGLATARSMIQQCGGAIHFHSQAGRGTSFLLYLPLGPPTAERTVPAGNSSPGLCSMKR